MSSSYLKTGLTNAQVRQNLKQFGYNEIPEIKEWIGLKIFFSQFKSFLIIVLIVAGGVSIGLKEYVDGTAIFAIVILNALIGFFQEYKAENAVKALKKMVVPKVVVLREGEKKEIPIRELVPEDLVILGEGDKIPADLEIIEAFSLQIDESILTGESAPVSKEAPFKKELARENRLFKGTIITTGRATAKVASTGKNTEFGKIVDLVSQQGKTRSPLSIQLDNLGRKLAIIILILILILFMIGFLQEIPLLNMFMTSVALGVSAIPEGMPIIVTLTLAMGVQILAKKKAIVRKMNSIETLGATTFICSDKTGTLTMNEMTVKVVNTNFKETEIPGSGYSIKEKIKLSSPEEILLAKIGNNCNNATLGKSILGDPTEISLKVLAQKSSIAKEYKELDELSFTSDRKMMSSLHQVDKAKIIYSKGAFEEIIKKCSRILVNGKARKITTTDRKKLIEINKEYAEKGLRVLAFAYKPFKGKFDEKDLIFVGLVGIIDPPRPSVAESIATAQKAGIKIRIITGDNPITAKAIGEKLGLNVTKTLTGQQIEKMSDKELHEAIQNTEIFARTSPQHKYRIVSLLKKSHEVVAVTGDGVNDAPALKHADVGIAMGIKGTEATKEVADIVLKDDNFTTIVNTIKEGRRIYHNILSFIKYMVSVNFDTIIIVGLVTIFGYPLPLLPLQILWINIATDALPALALGKSPASPGIMEEPPHPKQENIFKKFAPFIAVTVAFTTIANVIIFFYGVSIDTSLGIDLTNLNADTHTRTLIFTEVVLFEMFFVFVCKDERIIKIKSLFANKSLIGAVLISLILQVFMVYTPFMQKIFNTVPLTFKEWLILIFFASTAFLIPTVSNLFRKEK